MNSCPKCSCTSIQIAQGGTRCASCGYQEKGISSHQANKTYKSFASPSTQVYNHILHECEDLVALKSAWRSKKAPTQKPLISIIMPTYRRQHTIYETIGSILNQTFPAWELIVIDNEPENNYKFDDARIKYFQHSEERGAAYGRNMGVQYVSSEHVCFFDDDDIMQPTYLERMMMPFLQDPTVNMTHCRIKLVEGTITDHSNYCTPAAVVKAKFVTPCWQKATAHDIWFFSEIAERIPAESIIRVPEVLVHAYTSRHGGIRDGAL